MKQVSIIDYGIGNILSVRRAFENQCVKVKYVVSEEGIDQSEYLVLPGVGAFKNGMKELEDRNLINAIQRYCQENRPFLGICLGMQMMLDESEEFGKTSGLGIIPGKVVRMKDKDMDGIYQKVPQVGWNRLKMQKNTDGTILDGIMEGTEMYFVHSYTAVPAENKYRLADVDYGGWRISAVIQKGNCYGTQFHPEKSGKRGLEIINNFINI